MMKIKERKRANFHLKPEEEVDIDEYKTEDEMKEKIINGILCVNSIEGLTTLLIVVLISCKYIMFNELQIVSNKQFYFYYIILSAIISLFEIPLDIILTNIIECWSALKLSERIQKLQDNYFKRHRFWAIYDFSHLHSNETASLSLVEKLGFSLQYFVVLSLFCVSGMMSMLGLELMINYSYNPFTDIWLWSILFLTIFYFYALSTVIHYYFRKNDQKQKEFINYSTKPEEEVEIIRGRVKMRKNKDNIHLAEKEMLQRYLDQQGIKRKIPAHSLKRDCGQLISKEKLLFHSLKDLDWMDMILDEIVSKIVSESVLKESNQGQTQTENEFMTFAFEFLKLLEYNKIEDDLKKLEEKEQESIKHINSIILQKKSDYDSILRQKIEEVLEKRRSQSKNQLRKLLMAEKIPKKFNIDWEKLKNLKKVNKSSKQRRKLKNLYKRSLLPIITNNYIDIINFYIRLGIFHNGGTKEFIQSNLKRMKNNKLKALPKVENNSQMQRKKKKESPNKIQKKSNKISETRSNIQKIQKEEINPEIELIQIAYKPKLRSDIRSELKAKRMLEEEIPFSEPKIRSDIMSELKAKEMLEEEIPLNKQKISSDIKSERKAKNMLEEEIPLKEIPKSEKESKTTGKKSESTSCKRSILDENSPVEIKDVQKGLSDTEKKSKISKATKSTKSTKSGKRSKTTDKKSLKKKKVLNIFKDYE